MKVLILLITVLASALATQLLSADDVENLFRKHVRKELTKVETQQFQDVLDILRSRDYSAIISRDESFERMSIDCLVCWAAFSTVFEAVENGQPDEEIEHIVETLCYNLGIGGQSMCHGIAVLNVPIITHIIRTTPEATARSFCGNVLQTATDLNFCRVNDRRFEWTVDLPATPIDPPAIPVIDTKPLKIALITDAHIDPLYEAFGVAECSEINCCRKGQTPRIGTNKPKSETEKRVVEQSIVQKDGEVMLDISKASDLRQMRSSVESKHASARTPEPAGYWGDYRNCDTPIWAFDDVIERIAETHKDVDLVYYVGDTIDHHIWETTYDLINDMNRHLIDKIRSSFGDDVWVIPNIGNHESQPTNQFAPSRITGRYLNTTWLYDSLARKWDHYLPEGAKRTLRERGEFSLVVRPGLRVISLNTNVAYKYNWWLTYDPTDAKKHLEWLISELYEAEKAGEKVHIVSHIPPGVEDLTLTWTREYNRIVNRFTKTIVAEFNGHTHGDQIRIFYNPEGEPINVAWGGGSASSYTFYNVNYKILDIDTATYEPKTIENYIYNLTEANLTPNQRPHWFQLYEMKHSFRLTDLSAASMDDLFHRMVTTDRDLLDLYGAFHSRLSDYRWPQCDINCRLSRVCNSVITVLWDRQKCDEFIQLYHISNQ